MTKTKVLRKPGIDFKTAFDVVFDKTLMQVVFMFDRPITKFAIQPDDAINLGKDLIKHAEELKHGTGGIRS